MQVQFDTKLTHKGWGTPPSLRDSLSPAHPVMRREALVHLCPEMHANDIRCCFRISITKCHFRITSHLTELNVYW